MCLTLPELFILWQSGLSLLSEQEHEVTQGYDSSRTVQRGYFHPYPLPLHTHILNI